jgi:sulfate permease, SulP family
LMIGQLPDMFGIADGGHGTLHAGLITLRRLAETRAAPLLMVLAVIVIIVGAERVSAHVPGALLAVVLAVAATWLFRLDQHGIAVIGPVASGLPAIGVPRPPLARLPGLLPVTASMFLVIIAQSAATARSFAEKRDERLDENRDVVALGIANAVAGCSSTFIVNGSPTKTAVVVAAGGRTQVAQLAAAGVVLVVVGFVTAPIARLPLAALAAVVFLIGLKLIDLPMLARIYRFRKVTFAVALAALLGVVIFGVQTGIAVAIVLSILDHLRQEYRPKDVVLVYADALWVPRPADPGAESASGLIVYRFGAPLFFANADYFRSRVQDLIDGAPHRVQTLVLDLVSMSDIDFTAGLKLAALVRDVQQHGIAVALAQGADVRSELERAGVIALVEPAGVFDTVPAAIASQRAASLVT